MSGPGDVGAKPGVGSVPRAGRGRDSRNPSAGTGALEDGGGARRGTPAPDALAAAAGPLATLVLQQPQRASASVSVRVRVRERVTKHPGDAQWYAAASVAIPGASGRDCARTPSSLRSAHEPEVP